MNIIWAVCGFLLASVIAIGLFVVFMRGIRPRW